MSETNHVADRYVASLNETDAETRRRIIADLWAEDGSYITEQEERRGHAAIEARVIEAHEKWVKEGGFVFRVGSVAGHHDAVKFSWEMVPAGGGEVVASSADFLLLSDDGRIRLDYRF